MPSAHRLATALRSGAPSFGAWLTLPGTIHARTLARSSPHLDWVLIDCEHGLIPLVPGVAESSTAISSARVNGTGPSPVVRIPATGASTGTGWQIKHALDGGARGILVPFVSTAEKAKEVVADAKFPPMGRRGFGSPFTHEIWDVSAGEYLMGSANHNIIVMVQIEDRLALSNVDQIAAVEGIDVLFIGPFDLSISMGLPPPSPDPHPDAEEAIQKILRAAHGAGKKCGIYCTSGEQAARRAAQGFDLINVTSDVGALTDGVNKQLEAAVDGTSSKVKRVVNQVKY